MFCPGLSLSVDCVLLSYRPQHNDDDIMENSDAKRRKWRAHTFAFVRFCFLFFFVSGTHFLLFTERNR